MEEKKMIFPVPKIEDISSDHSLYKLVFFHAVNKSGSLALIELFRESYALCGRSNEFLTPPIGYPNSLMHVKEKIDAKKNQIYIAHNLVEYYHDYPSAMYFTILRNPLKRLISCYYWLKKHHPEFINNRDLLTWAKESGHTFTNTFQFACFDGIKQKERIAQLPLSEMIDMSREWFKNNIQVFGITEYFEESIFWFASHLKLSKVVMWKADKRNVCRPKWDLFKKSTFLELQNIIDYDVEFYEHMKNKFLLDVVKLKEYSSFKNYINSSEKIRQDQHEYGANFF